MKLEIISILFNHEVEFVIFNVLWDNLGGQ